MNRIKIVGFLVLIGLLSVGTSFTVSVHAQAVKGAYLLEDSGAVYPVGDIADLPSSLFSTISEQYKKMQVFADPTGEVIGYYVLGNEGSIIEVGEVPTFDRVPGEPPFFGWDIARDLEPAIGWNGVTNEQVGMYELDGFGGIHLWGQTPENETYFKVYQNSLVPYEASSSEAVYTYFGWDIARDLETSYIWEDDGEIFARLNGYYVLDGFGGVHWNVEDAAGDPAPAPWAGVSGGLVQPYFGWDIATDLELYPNGLGYALIDGYGNLHFGGVSPTGFFSPEFAADAATVWNGIGSTNLALNLPGPLGDIKTTTDGVWVTDFELVMNETFFGWYAITNTGEVYSQPKDAAGDQVYADRVPELVGPDFNGRKGQDIELNPQFQIVTDAE